MNKEQELEKLRFDLIEAQLSKLSPKSKDLKDSRDLEKSMVDQFDAENSNPSDQNNNLKHNLKTVQSLPQHKFMLI